MFFGVHQQLLWTSAETLCNLYPFKQRACEYDSLQHNVEGANNNNCIWLLHIMTPLLSHCEILVSLFWTTWLVLWKWKTIWNIDLCIICHCHLSNVYQLLQQTFYLQSMDNNLLQICQYHILLNPRLKLKILCFCELEFFL